MGIIGVSSGLTATLMTLNATPEVCSLLLCVLFFSLFGVLILSGTQVYTQMGACMLAGGGTGLIIARQMAITDLPQV